MTHTSPRGRRRIARLAGKFISFPRRGSGGTIWAASTGKRVGIEGRRFRSRRSSGTPSGDDIRPRIAWNRAIGPRRAPAHAPREGPSSRGMSRTRGRVISALWRDPRPPTVHPDGCPVPRGSTRGLNPFASHGILRNARLSRVSRIHRRSSTDPRLSIHHSFIPLGEFDLRLSTHT